MKIIFIIFITITFLFISYKLSENFNYNRIDPIYCNGCLDENLKCHTNCVPMCSNEKGTLCYAFYDANGNLKTPCSLYDLEDDVELSCSNCQNYCILCEDGKSKPRCISRSIFNCTLCPKSRSCISSPFDLVINKNKFR